MNELIKLWVSVTEGKEIEEFESDVQKLYDYTMNLQKENEQLQELECTIGIVEHNRIISEKNKEIHQLKERIEYLERSNNRREDTILEQRQEISDLEDNWIKLKEWLDSEIENQNHTTHWGVKKRMKELEGSEE